MSDKAREIAAQAWCYPATKSIDMQPELAEAFADILSQYIEREERLVKLIKHWRVTAPYCETVDDASALCDCADELEAILNR